MGIRQLYTGIGLFLREGLREAGISFTVDSFDEKGYMSVKSALSDIREIFNVFSFRSLWSEALCAKVSKSEILQLHPDNTEHNATNGFSTTVYTNGLHVHGLHAGNGQPGKIVPQENEPVSSRQQVTRV